MWVHWWLAGDSLPGLQGEGLEGDFGEAHDAPLGEDFGSDGLVEVDGGGVPFEDVPLQARAALFDGDAGEVDEQGLADSLPSSGWGDVEVFEADAVVAAPGGVAGEVKGEAGGLRDGVAGEFGYEAMEARGWAEAVSEQVGFGGEDCVGFALEGR